MFSDVLSQAVFASQHPEQCQDEQRTVKISKGRGGRPAKPTKPRQSYGMKFPNIEADFDKGTAFVFTGAPPPGSDESLGNHVRALSHAVKVYTDTDFNEKKTGIEEILTKTQTTWGGAMTALNFLPGSIEHIAETGVATETEIPLNGTEGSAPWIVAMRSFKCRWGAQQVPNTGFAQLVQAKSPNLWMLLFPVEPILTKGLTISTMRPWLDTSEGVEYLEQHAQAFPLGEGDFAYVPFGVAWTALHVPLIERGVPPPSELAIVVAQTIFDECVSGNDAKTTTAAVLSHNIDHAKTKSSSQMWKARLATLKAFQQAVQEA